MKRPDRAYANRFMSGALPGGLGNWRIGMGFVASLPGGAAACPDLQVVFCNYSQKYGHILFIIWQGESGAFSCFFAIKRVY